MGVYHEAVLLGSVRDCLLHRGGEEEAMSDSSRWWSRDVRAEHRLHERGSSGCQMTICQDAALDTNVPRLTTLATSSVSSLARQRQRPEKHALFKKEPVVKRDLGATKKEHVLRRNQRQIKENLAGWK